MLAVVVGLAGLVSLGAAARPGVVDGTRFVLRDDAGHVRAVLAVVDGAMRSHLPIDVASAGPMLALYDSKGAVRATLGVAQRGEIDAPALSLFDANEGLRASLGEMGGGTGLSFADEQGIGRLGLFWRRGQSVLHMEDPRTKAQAELGIVPGGQASLWLSGGEGKPQASVYVAGRGPEGVQSGVSLFDARGELQAQLGRSERSGARRGVTLYDGNGRPRVVLDVADSGPRLILSDDAGHDVFQAPQPRE